MRTAGWLMIAGLMFAPPLAAQEMGGPVASESDCATPAARIAKDFDAGAFASCEADSETGFTLTIVREDANVTNPSPWYAFRVDPARPGEITVTLEYEGAGHRYWPKTSSDGVSWARLPESAVAIIGGRNDRSARLTLQLSDAPVFIAAQEILTPPAYAAWLGQLGAQPHATRNLLGRSAQGREIEMLRIAAPGATPRETVVLVGRQHPPEVSGALAMMAFVDTIMGNSELASAYRARFETLVVPLLNPDGVVEGHWRHGTGGVDLNRDWGPFTQPETTLMRDLLAEVAADPDRKLRALIDFHSTGEDVFYTIPDELPTDPELFTRRWLDFYQQRMPGYVVNRDARHDVGRPISKAYAYDTFGIPGVTFEIGDETDRALIADIGREAAYAMMLELLRTPPSVIAPLEMHGND